MSRNLESAIVNSTELKVLIIREYGNQKQFCKAHKINHNTFRKYLSGWKMPKIERKVIEVMRSHNLNPDGTQIN